MTSQLRALKSEILAVGKDLWINQADAARIRDCLPADASTSLDDLKVLIEMRAEARAVCPEFDALFFPALKQHLLSDGRVSPEEQILLLRMLYGGGGIDDAERRFIQELRQELTEVSPEFEALYRDAMLE